MGEQKPDLAEGQVRAPETPGGPERRAHPRIEAVIPVEVDVGTYGPTVVGATVNLSRGGALVEVDHPVTVGESCTVRFPKLAGRDDTIKSATSVRVSNVGATYLVGLRFEDPLPESSALVEEG